MRAWRVDQAIHKTTWDSAIGAHASGGRWNPKGQKALYCSLDAATSILEVAVHKGFRALDRVPHVITSLTIAEPIAGVRREARRRTESPMALDRVAERGPAGGAELLAVHDFIAIPSAVSQHSWNLIFDPDRAAGKYTFELQEALSIDTRLNPPRS